MQTSRQIITPILPNVKVLSLGSERLTPKVLDHYLHYDLAMLSLLFCFLLIYYLLGKGGYVFGSVGLSVCLSVNNITQKVMNGLR